MRHCPRWTGFERAYRKPSRCSKSLFGSGSDLPVASSAGFSEQNLPQGRRLVAERGHWWQGSGHAEGTFRRELLSTCLDAWMARGRRGERESCWRAGTICATPHRHWCGAARDLRPPARETGPSSRTSPKGPYAPSQHRDHRPRRSRQDHAGRCPAQAVGGLPPEPEGGSPGARQQRPGARARHYDSRQVHVRRLGRHAHQHRRHAGPRRLRRRGGAHPQHGGRRHRAGGRRRGAAAADQVRGLQGPQAGPQAHRRHQQDRPARRAPQRRPERDLRSVRGPGRQRRAARLSRALRLGPRGLDGARSCRPAHRSGAAVRPHPEARAAAGRRGRPVPPARHHAGGRSLPRPRAHRAHPVWQRAAQPGHQGAAPRRLA